jgi:hypothetical protein
VILSVIRHRQNPTCYSRCCPTWHYYKEDNSLFATIVSSQLQCTETWVGIPNYQATA